jgi:hypothetical protein
MFGLIKRIFFPTEKVVVVDKRPHEQVIVLHPQNKKVVVAPHERVVIVRPRQPTVVVRK